MSRVCGIDEAGRGCLAGDLCMTGVIFLGEIEFRTELKDSKKLCEKKRESLYDKICKNSNFKIVTFTSLEVDKFGLSKCLKTGLLEIENWARNLKKDINIIFDGNRNFGVNGIETMIKGDAKVAEISAASILAKVSRDRNLQIANEKYPNFNFLSHKGYATKAHIQALTCYGYTEFHRKSYKVKGLNFGNKEFDFDKI